MDSGVEPWDIPWFGTNKVIYNDLSVLTVSEAIVKVSERYNDLRISQI